MTATSPQARSRIGLAAFALVMLQAPLAAACTGPPPYHQDLVVLDAVTGEEALRLDYGQSDPVCACKRFIPFDGQALLWHGRVYDVASGASKPVDAKAQLVDGIAYSQVGDEVRVTAAAEDAADTVVAIPLQDGRLLGSVVVAGGGTDFNAYDAATDAWVAQNLDISTLVPASASPILATDSWFVFVWQDHEGRFARGIDPTGASTWPVVELHDDRFGGSAGPAMDAWLDGTVVRWRENHDASAAGCHTAQWTVDLAEGTAQIAAPEPRPGGHELRLVGSPSPSSTPGVPPRSEEQESPGPDAPGSGSPSPSPGWAGTTWSTSPSPVLTVTVTQTVYEAGGSPDASGGRNIPAAALGVVLVLVSLAALVRRNLE